ncbi:MAG: formate transporter [Planctomycetota bacterium]|jgi:formate transporter
MAGNTPLDSLLPAEMAEKAESIGTKKARLDAASTFTLAVLAGAFIALGGVFATTVWTGDGMQFGLARLLGGVAFSLGLILVIVGGAELFTGNNLIVMAWAAGKIRVSDLIRNWAIVYFGNLVGAVGTAVLVFLAQQHTLGNGAVGVKALAIAEAKCSLGFVPALFLGILCNALVCLAVWMTFSARTTTDRVLAILPPITAFVAVGFEHCIANMYFIPVAILIKAFAPATYWEQIGRQPTDFASIDAAGLWNNLLPVTLGNIIGGCVLVGAVYWFVYLRPRRNS